MRKEFARNIESLENVFEFLHQFMALHPIRRETGLEIDLIVEELFTNSVKHNRDSVEPVVISLENNENNLTITVKDKTSQPFDMTNVPDPNLDQPVDQRFPGGLGIVLVKQLSDSVRYEYRDRVSTITVTKKVE